MRGLALICLFIWPCLGIGQASYWQQELRVSIDVRLDDVKHFLYATESIDYTNNSPDTLEILIFHLWPNAYDSKGSAMSKQLIRIGETSMLFASAEEMGYIDSLAFTLDGEPCLWEYDPTHQDICTLFLEKPLPPKGSVVVATPFRVKLPSGEISRLGHVGESYQITQWYPKPAVYDHAGWHPMPYLTQGEFYSEFGSFDVRITLPSNYVVGATGDLQDQGEIDFLHEKVKDTEVWIKKLDIHENWNDILDQNDFPPSAESTKTLRFIQENVHDFAWFADKRYHVLHGEVELPHSKNKMDVWTMFTNGEAHLWRNSIEYMHDAIYYYSLWNGDYPYQHATAVDGTISAGGGMEYPNITVIGASQNALGLETVIMHEVGHNWFYGILGTNERQYPWMDEGLNSYNEQRYFTTKYPNGKLLVGDKVNRLSKFAGLDNYLLKDMHYLTYLLVARANTDQSLKLSSAEFRPLNYGAVVYSKSAVWFEYLRYYLGDSLMDAAMKGYTSTYSFKHPYPEDFTRIFTETAGDDLDWLFIDALSGTSKLDYAIRRVKVRYNQTELKITNAGGIAGPLPVAFVKDGEVANTVWFDGFYGTKKLQVEGVYDEVIIDKQQRMPEIRRQNNHWHAKGLFKRLEPMQLKLLGQLEDPRRTQLFYLPVVGWNLPNGWMPGVALYNSILPVKKLNWMVMPMFATSTQSLSGAGEVYYAFTPLGSHMETIDLGVKARRFANQRLWSQDQLVAHYMRVEPYVRFNFRPYAKNGMWDDELTLSSVILQDETLVKELNQDWQNTTSMSVFTRLNYLLSFDHPAYPIVFQLQGEGFSDFLRGHIEVVNHLDFNGVVRIRNRFFGGYFFSNKSVDPRYNWRMDGQRPQTDYARDAIWLDRSGQDDFLNGQLSETHGGFKIPTAVGGSNVGLISYNTELFLSKLPIGVFGDLGYSLNGVALADAGVCIATKDHLFGIYLPLIYTANIADEVLANGREWFDLVRFQVSFDLMNPFLLRRNLLL